MVIELKWPYDKKRYTLMWTPSFITPSFMAESNCNDVNLLCRRFAQDIKFVLGAIAIKEQEEKGAVVQKRQRRTDTRPASHFSTSVKSAKEVHFEHIHNMYSFISCFRRRWLPSLFHSQREERLPQKPSSLFLLFLRPLERLRQLLPPGFDYLNYTRNILTP